MLVWMYERLTKEPLHVLLKIHDLYAILYAPLCYSTRLQKMVAGKISGN